MEYRVRKDALHGRFSPPWPEHETCSFLWILLLALSLFLLARFDRGILACIVLSITLSMVAEIVATYAEAIVYNGLAGHYLKSTIDTLRLTETGPWARKNSRQSRKFPIRGPAASPRPIPISNQE